MAMPLRSAHRRQKFFASPIRSALDKMLFSVAFFGGFVAIIGMKLSGFSQFWATAVAVGIMFAYVAIVWASNRFRIREDHIGDNVYYLGFLFTLVSLGHALWAFADGITDDTIGNVISNFGIALVSTIVGVWLRVLVNQLRSDPVEIEREARVELAEASNSVRAEMSAMLVDVSDFRRQILQVMREAIEETATATQKSLQENTSRMGDTAHELLKRVDSAAENYSSNANRMNELVARTGQALEKLSNRIDGIEVPSDLITSQLDPVIAKILEVTEKIQGHSDIDREHTKSVAEAIAQVQTAMPALTASLAEAKNISISVGELNTQISALQERLSNISEAQMKQSSSVRNSVESFDKSIKAHTENMIAQHALFEESVSKLSKALEKNVTLGAPQPTVAEALEPTARDQSGDATENNVQPTDNRLTEQ